MKVSDLIKKLQLMPQDVPVYYEDATDNNRPIELDYANLREPYAGNTAWHEAEKKLRVVLR